MERDVWIMAAWLVGRHGFDAAVAVADKLEALEHDCAEQAKLLLWLHVREAVLELMRRQPAPSEAVH